jgi:hypothetical protein
MSNENLQPGQHGEVGYEHRDLSARAVYTFLICLGVLTVLIIFMLRGVYSFLDSYERNHQAPPSPLAAKPPDDPRKVPPDVRSQFPEPRLEVDERGQLTGFVLDQEKALHSYGYVDQQAGVVRIPIERAMQLVAQRGLPVRPPGASESAGPGGKSSGAKPAASAKAAAAH